DLLQGHEHPRLLVRQPLGAKQLAQQLQQATDRLVVALRPRRASTQGASNLEDQVDVPWQHRVDVHKIVRRDRVTPKRIVLQERAIVLKQLSERRLSLGLLLQKPPVNDVTDVRRGKVDP